MRESRNRVRSAIFDARFEFPRHRMAVNLATADLPKQGSRFDLAIAIGILAASGQLPAAFQEYEFYAELALSGNLRAIGGILPSIIQAKRMQRKAIIAVDNLAEAAVVRGVHMYPAQSLAVER